MASIDSLKASDGSGNASVVTVQNTRSAGATTIIGDTVQGINTNFHATMGTPHTFTDPVTGETITIISEATAVDFKGHVDGSNLEIDTIAPGFTDAGSAVGDIVIIKPTTQVQNEMADILEVAHSDDGNIATDTIAEKTAAAGVTIDGLLIKDSKLATDNSVVTENITDGAVTGAKLANVNEEYRTAFPATNIDVTSSTFVDFNTAFTNVNVPTWATKAHLIVSAPILTVSAVTDAHLMVLIGTDQGSDHPALKNSHPNNGLYHVVYSDAITLTSTGSKTIKLQAKRTAGTGAVRCQASASRCTVRIAYLP